MAEAKRQAAIFVGDGDPMMALRDDDIAHGLREEAFDDATRAAILERDDAKAVSYDSLPSSAYAVPTAGHYLPLPTVLGAAAGEQAEAFDNVQNLGSMAMTSYAFGLAG